MNINKEIILLTVILMTILCNQVSGKMRKPNKNRKRIKDQKMWKYVKHTGGPTALADNNEGNIEEPKTDLPLGTPVDKTEESTVINTSEANVSPQVQVNLETVMTTLKPEVNSENIQKVNIVNTVSSDSPATEQYLKTEDFFVFNNELDNLTNNLQQISKDWHSNVRFHCSNSWKAIQEILEDNRKALIEWQIALFDIINNIYSTEDYDLERQDTTESLEDQRDSVESVQDQVNIEPMSYNLTDIPESLTVPPELDTKYSMIKNAVKHKQNWAESDAEDDKDNEDDAPEITGKCVSAINLAEALRVYWKEEILECLQKYLREIKHEEVAARHFEDKIRQITANSLANITSECQQWHGRKKAECTARAWHKVRGKLKGLRQELERHYLNHEVQNLQITMGIEMCRQVGIIYDKTMDQQLQAIQHYSGFY